MQRREILKFPLGFFVRSVPTAPLAITMRQASIPLSAIRLAVASGVAVSLPVTASPLLAALAFFSLVKLDQSRQKSLRDHPAPLQNAAVGGDDFHFQTASPWVLKPDLRFAPTVTRTNTVINTANGRVEVGEGVMSDMTEWEMSLFSRYGLPPPGNSSARHLPSKAAAEAVADAWSSMLGQPLHRLQVQQVRWWEAKNKAIVTALSKPLDDGRVLGVVMDSSTMRPLNPVG